MRVAFVSSRPVVFVTVIWCLTEVGGKVGKQKNEHLFTIVLHRSLEFLVPPHTHTRVQVFLCVLSVFFSCLFSPSTNVLAEEGVSMFSNKSKIKHFDSDTFIYAYV